MNILYLLFQAARVWLERGGSYYAAAFSYYAPLALIPLLFFTVSVSGFLYGDTFAKEVFASWGSALGDDVLSLIRFALDNLREETAAARIPLIAGGFFLGFYIIAINVVSDGFLKFWGRETRGLKAYIFKSLRALLFLFVLQAYIVVIIGLDYFVIPTLFGDNGFYSSALLYISTTTFFAVLYRYLTSRPPSWLGCMYGALISSMFFVIIKFLVDFYIATTPVLSLYGAAGLILVLFVWVYVLSAIIFYGAAVAGLYDRLKNISAGIK